MFTGIVRDVGSVVSREPRGGDVRLVIAFDRLDPAGIQVGDSICVQGCCLTAVALRDRSFAADLSRETLSLTTLGELTAGSPVNLEPSLRAGDPLGGHLISGHVDGIGEIVGISGDARSSRIEISVPPALCRYIARKGSVAIDGVSLTTNEVQGGRFGINLIPHTRAVTTLGALRVGGHVNVEVDQIARYLERLLSGDGDDNEDWRREQVSGHADPNGRVTDPTTGLTSGNDQNWVGGVSTDPLSHGRDDSAV
ncbi:MAG: riboflavin synthase [Steroidobacteraceae bacterium]